jgi:hypothetical protein
VPRHLSSSTERSSCPLLLVHMSATRGVVDIGAGTFAGVMGTVFGISINSSKRCPLTISLPGHPLDTIKVRLQTQSHYKSAVDCAVQLFRNEGVRRLIVWLEYCLFFE